MCILFAHRDQKCYHRNAACSLYHFESSAHPPSRTNGRRRWRLLMLTFQRRLLVGLHTEGRRSSQCLTAENFFTTVVQMFCLFIFFSSYFLLLDILKAFLFLMLFFFTLVPTEGIFQKTNVAGSQSEPSSHRLRGRRRPVDWNTDTLQTTTDFSFVIEITKKDVDHVDHVDVGLDHV